MNEDLRLEKQLFNTTEHASQGINFDRVRTSDEDTYLRACDGCTIYAVEVARKAAICQGKQPASTWKPGPLFNHL